MYFAVMQLTLIPACNRVVYAWEGGEYGVQVVDLLVFYLLVAVGTDQAGMEVQRLRN